jgi:manganese/zinc/iron transport system permease protein
MTIQQIEIQLIASVVAVACSLVGTFLILRKIAMASDAISHTVLLGIVVTFFIVRDLHSPVLILGATITGVLTFGLVELLIKTKLIKEDAAIGLVFPALFSIAVILISRHAADVHLDNDAVLFGELAFAPFSRFIMFGVDIGPQSLIIMSIILLIIILFIIIFYKELKLSTFDSDLAAALGFMPGLIHYLLISLVSVTAVGAFDAVGSILVVALMIGPPVTAYLLTDKLPVMLGLSALFGLFSAVSGYWAANLLDSSIAGSMATMVGVFFLGTFLFAPERGIIALIQRRKKQKYEFAMKMLVIHLLNHENSPDYETESKVGHMHEEMHWNPDFAVLVIKRAVQKDWIIQRNGHVDLTDLGRQVAHETMEK